MSEPRKSSKQATARRIARERATERAAQFRARQQRLEELAVEYFVAADQVDRIEERGDEEIAAIRARVERDVASARAAADDVVQRMLDTDVTRAEVAERLGIPVRDVKRQRDATVDAGNAPAVSVGVGHTESDASATDEESTVTDTAGTHPDPWATSTDGSEGRGDVAAVPAPSVHGSWPA